MLSSPDFTQLEVDQLFESWLTEFEVVKQQATRRHALAIEEKTETSNPTVLKLDEAVRRLELYKHSIVSDASPDSHTVDLFVTSTRKLRANGLITSVTDERSDKLAFGAVRVRVPDEHRIGEVERPLAVRIFGLTIYRERQDDKQHFVIKSKSWITQDEFLEAIREHDAKQALIFVHGFNTTFDEGVFRLAQIVWDTQFDGVPILFSWPSKGTILSYLYDRESSTFSVNGFLELLTLLQTSTDISTIHILAHSMGNQIVVSALANSKDIALKALGEVILAAPDVDRDVFKGLAVRIAGIPSRGVTLYASSADKAMSASRKLAQGPRAGDVLPPPDGPVVLPKIETIDVTAVGDELFGLNHDTFAVHRSIIDDIGRLILRGDRPPNQRSVEIRGVPEGRQPPLYWRYAR